VVGGCIATLSAGLLAVIVHAAARSSESHSEFSVHNRFHEHQLPSTRRAPFGFLAVAKETDDTATGIRSFRVLVDRDLEPGWFGNPAFGVCTKEKVRGVYSLDQMENACGGSRLGGGFSARVALRDGHVQTFSAELFAARVDGERALLLHLARLGHSPSHGGPAINLWGPVYRVERKPFRWGYRLRVPTLAHRSGRIHRAVITRIKTDFDPGRRGAWRGHCDDRRLTFEGKIVIKGQAPDVRRIAKRCVPTSG
jgi:hypothetical protein